VTLSINVPWNLCKIVQFFSKFVMVMRNEYAYKYVALMAVHCSILTDAHTAIALFYNLPTYRVVKE